MRAYAVKMHPVDSVNNAFRSSKKDVFARGRYHQNLKSSEGSLELENAYVSDLRVFS